MTVTYSTGAQVIGERPTAESAVGIEQESTRRERYTLTHKSFKDVSPRRRVIHPLPPAKVLVWLHYTVAIIKSEGVQIRSRI